MVNIKKYLNKSSPQTASTTTDTPASASTENLNSSVMETSNPESENPLTEPLPQNPSAQKRNRSQNSESEDTKRQNLNDTLSSTNSTNISENICSDLLDLDRSIFDQLEVSFEGKTPHWVPLLIKSFDALNRELSSNMRSLSEEVKSINGKFDTFSTEISRRIESLEKDSDTLKKNQGEIANDISALQTQVTTMKKKGEEQEKGINFVSSQYEDIKKEFSNLNTKNQNMQKTIVALTNQIDNMEQHNRNECLVLHGIPEKAKELPHESVNLFVQTVNEHLGLNTEINADMIRRAHGKKRTDGKSRPITARIWSSNLRNDIYFSKKKLKDKSISITENLTQRRLEKLKKAEEQYGKKQVWTKEGRIYSKDDKGIIKLIYA